MPRGADPRATRLLEVVFDIDRALERDDLTSSPIHSTSGWLGGTLLLNAYLHCYVPNPDRAKKVDALLELTMQYAAKTAPLGLYTGLSGFAWLLTHVGGMMGQAPEVDEVDKLIAHRLGLPWNDDFDLVKGLVGIGFFALERMEQGSGADILGRVIERLADSAEPHVGGLAWYTEARLLPPSAKQKYPNGYYNLGLAHGVGGVMCLLSRAIARGVRIDLASDLLEQSSEWMRSAIRPWDGTWILPSLDEPDFERKHRLAWCYNELAGMVSLATAARALGREDWLSQSREVLLSTADTPFERSGVRDAALCHGAAGVGHLFAWAARELDEPALGEAAHRWFDRVLEMRRPGGEGIAGFLYPAKNELDRPIEVGLGGFLEGASGIALALLCEATGIEPRWDRLLGLR